MDHSESPVVTFFRVPFVHGTRRAAQSPLSGGSFVAVVPSFLDHMAPAVLRKAALFKDGFSGKNNTVKSRFSSNVVQSVYTKFVDISIGILAWLLVIECTFNYHEQTWGT